VDILKKRENAQGKTPNEQKQVEKAKKRLKSQIILLILNLGTKT
jgi:hypothetical protein